MLRVQHIVTILVLGLFGTSVFAQQGLILNYDLEGIHPDDSKDLPKAPVGRYADSLEAFDATENFVFLLQISGFAGAEIRSMERDNDTLWARVYVGPHLRWKEIRRGNISQELIEELRFSNKMFSSTVFQPQEYYDLAEKIIIFYENRGYPFVTVKLDSLEFWEEKKEVSAALSVDPGRLFKMDTLDLYGNAELRKNFLYNYLGFRPGEPYSEKLIKDIDNKLSQLPFVKSKSPSRVYFLFDKAHVVLDLEKRKTDRMDGIVGFAPNSDASDKQDLLVTGEVNVDLKNLMGSAKAFNLHWKNFDQRSQELKVGTNLPYLWNQPVGIDGFAHIYKYDTLTINVRSGLGVQYLFQGTNYLRFYYENSLSILQTIDTNLIRLNRALPTTNPVNINTYGMDLSLTDLDYNINPRKGYQVQLKFGVGAKKIESDSRIEQVLFTNGNGDQYSLYDSIDDRIFSGSFEYELAWYLPIGDKSVIVPGIQGKHIESKRIFFDELYRIGGNNDLRGFDEQLIRASSYHLYNLEYRYLISRNSYFSGFVNGAYYRDQSEGNDEEDFPLGFGVGVNLEVSSGILRMAFALGQQKENPIVFNQAKIHFGIISYI